MSALGQRIPFQNLRRLHHSIESELHLAFDHILENSAFVGGKAVQKFEQAFASWLGLPYCLGVGNGTDAIEIALEALGVGDGDDVALPSLTFMATGEAVVRAGARPIFLEVDPQTLCLSEASFKKTVAGLKQKPKALIVVHLYGRACDMGAISTFCKEQEILLIEDCAQAHGAKWKGQSVGSWGEIGTFSFYPGKNLGALGDGGAIVTRSHALFSSMSLLRDHGRTQKYLHDHIGRNSRLDGLQAAFLSVKLGHLDQWNHARYALAQAYEKRLEGLSEIEILPVPNQPEAHVFHLFVIKVRGDGQRDRLLVHLKEHQIEALIHYPYGLHQQPAMAQFGPFPGLEHTTQVTSKILSLPMDPLMSLAEVETVCTRIREFFRG